MLWRLLCVKLSRKIDMVLLTENTYLSSAESIFLSCFFSALNKSGIRYAVMRNYETLPYSSGGSDLDILVAPEDATKAEALLYQAIAQAGGVSCGLVKSIGFFKVNAFGNPVPNSIGWWGQSTDVYVGWVFKGRLLFGYSDWSNLSKSQHGIPVLVDAVAGVIGVLKESLVHSRMPSRYLPAAKAAVEHDWVMIQNALKNMGKDALSLVHKMLTSCDSSDDVTLRCRHIRTTLMFHALRTQPILYFWQRFLSWWSKMHRYLKPSGTFLVILGVDGAGKSTVINAIKPVLDAATHNATFIQHLRPGLLPPLARLKGKGEAPSGPVLDPHGSTPSGILGSLLRLTYLTLDYILGYWLCTRLKIAKQPAIVLFDRYAYDMALDPRRFRVGLQGWVTELFARCAPRPDLIICLHADPEVIAARKQELPLEETRRQVEALRAFAKTQPNAVLISTEGSIAEVRERVLGALFDFFSKRNGS